MLYAISLQLNNRSVRQQYQSMNTNMFIPITIPMVLIAQCVPKFQIRSFFPNSDISIFISQPLYEFPVAVVEDGLKVMLTGDSQLAKQQPLLSKKPSNHQSHYHAEPPPSNQCVSLLLFNFTCSTSLEVLVLFRTSTQYLVPSMMLVQNQYTVLSMLLVPLEHSCRTCAVASMHGYCVLYSGTSINGHSQQWTPT